LAASLRSHPRAGRKVPEAGRDELRQMLHGKYRLIYRIEPTRLVVLTVRHCRRARDPGDITAEGYVVQVASRVRHYRPLLLPNADVLGSGGCAAALYLERSQENAVR